MRTAVDPREEAATSDRGWDVLRQCRIPILLAILALLSWGNAPAVLAQVGHGRPVIVRPRRDLSAGDIFAGVPKPVSRLDPANSGLYRIQGRPGAEISLYFTLPSELSSSSGATLTIEFAPGDAGIADDQNQLASVAFDPHAPLTVRLGRDGRAFVWLGGTVRPAAAQAPGYYEASVVLTADYTGS
jgi:hypothetical protein